MFLSRHLEGKLEERGLRGSGQEFHQSLALEIFQLQTFDDFVHATIFANFPYRNCLYPTLVLLHALRFLFICLRLLEELFQHATGKDPCQLPRHQLSMLPTCSVNSSQLCHNAEYLRFHLHHSNLHLPDGSLVEIHFVQQVNNLSAGRVQFKHRGPKQSVWVADCYFIVNVLDIPFASPIAIYR